MEKLKFRRWEGGYVAETRYAPDGTPDPEDGRLDRTYRIKRVPGGWELSFYNTLASGDEGEWWEQRQVFGYLEHAKRRANAWHRDRSRKLTEHPELRGHLADTPSTGSSLPVGSPPPAIRKAAAADEQARPAPRPGKRAPVCDRCGRRGTPYTYRGRRFGGLFADRGERLCERCLDHAHHAELDERLLAASGGLQRLRYNGPWDYQPAETAEGVHLARLQELDKRRQAGPRKGNARRQLHREWAGAVHNQLLVQDDETHRRQADPADGSAPSCQEAGERHLVTEAEPPGPAAGEQVSAVAPGVPEDQGHGDCDLCLQPLGPADRFHRHDRCAAVEKADDERWQFRDDRDLELVEREARDRGRRPYQIAPGGWEGSAVYCGQPILGADGDYWCPEHQCEVDGDEDGAAREHHARIIRLLSDPVTTKLARRAERENEDAGWERQADAARWHPGDPTPMGKPVDEPAHPATPMGPMEAPGIEAAQMTAAAQHQRMQAAVSGAEQYVNDLLAAGMAGDKTTLQAVAAARDATCAAAAAWQKVLAELSKHASGEEYAGTGHAARTEWLRH